MTPEEIQLARNQLIRIAVELITYTEFSTFSEDYGWCKTTPRTDRGKIIMKARMLDARMKRTAVDLRKIADMMIETKTRPARG